MVEKLLPIALKYALDGRKPIDRPRPDSDPHPAPGPHEIKSFGTYLDAFIEGVENHIDNMLQRNGKKIHWGNEAIADSHVILIPSIAMERDGALVAGMTQIGHDFIRSQVDRQKEIIKREPVDNRATWKERKKVSDHLGNWGLAGPRDRGVMRWLERTVAKADDVRETATGDQLEEMAVNMYAYLVTNKFPNLADKLLNQFYSYSPEKKLEVLNLAQIKSFITDIFTEGDFYSLVVDKLQEEAKRHVNVGSDDAYKRGFVTFLFGERSDIYPKSGDGKIMPDDKLMRLGRDTAYANWADYSVDVIMDNIDRNLLLKAYHDYLEMGGMLASGGDRTLHQMQSMFADAMRKSAHDVIDLGLKLPAVHARHLLQERANNGMPAHSTNKRQVRDGAELYLAESLDVVEGRNNLNPLDYLNP